MDTTETPKGDQSPKKGDFPHKFTREESRRGAERTNELKRERARTEREKLEEVYDKHREQLLQVVIDEVKKGNMQAFFGLHDRIYGTPAKSEPERVELDIGGSEARGVTLQEIIGSVSQAPSIAALNGQTGNEGLDQAKG